MAENRRHNEKNEVIALETSFFFALWPLPMTFFLYICNMSVQYAHPTKRLKL